MAIINKLRNSFRWLRARRFLYRPLVEVLLYQDALLHNLHEFQTKFSDLNIAPVLKSNAYGHGLLPIAQILKNEKIPFLCVDSFFEALILRNENINSPILILGYTPFDNITHSNLPDLYFSILSLNELKRLSADCKKNIKIHLKINTGMNRHGLNLAECAEALELIKQNPHITLHGVYTHLADADLIASVMTKKQIDLWNKAVLRIKEVNPGVKYFHCSASSGAFYNSEIDANTMRLGLGLYGINSGQNQMNLKPVMEMKTKITSLKSIQVGESIGYNATFMAERPMLLATIPLGYNEGLDRRLSNRGFVEIKGEICPLVGRVSMNISSIDVSALSELELEEEVTVISRQALAPNSIENMSKIGNIIPYDILVHISPSLRRKVV